MNDVVNKYVQCLFSDLLLLLYCCVPVPVVRVKYYTLGEKIEMKI